MKRKERAICRSHRRVANTHLITGGDAQGFSDRPSSVPGDHGGYVNDWGQAESIKREFQRLANGLARLGRLGRKADVINLMAWEIGDLRSAIAHAVSNRKEGRPDEVR